MAGVERREVLMVCERNKGVARLGWGGEDFSVDVFRSAGFRALLRYSNRLILCVCMCVCVCVGGGGGGGGGGGLS